MPLILLYHTLGLIWASKVVDFALLMFSSKMHQDEVVDDHDVCLIGALPLYGKACQGGCSFEANPNHVLMMDS